MILNTREAQPLYGYRQKTVLAALAQFLLPLGQDEEVELNGVRNNFGEELTVKHIRASISIISRDHQVAFATKTNDGQNLTIRKI